MKTTRLFPVKMLRIYTMPKETISTVNKVKSMKVAALVLLENLPDADGNDSGNPTLQLTAKQLDNLASVCRIKGTGRQAWDYLAECTGSCESVAAITLDPHRKGDSYIGTDGNEHEYQADGVNPTVDIITFSVQTRDKLRAGVINRQVNWNYVNSGMNDLLAGLNTTAPKLTIEQNSAPIDPAVAGK